MTKSTVSHSGHGNRRLWRFEVGCVYAGVRVLERQSGRTVSGDRYLVEYECCGKSQLITHTSLCNRVRDGRVGCVRCGQGARLEWLDAALEEPRSGCDVRLFERWERAVFGGGAA